MRVTGEHFRQGLTFDEYVAQIGTNMNPEVLATALYRDTTEVRNTALGLPATARERETWALLSDGITIAPEDRAALAKAGPLNILVITEDWSGDSLFNLTVLGRLVEGLPDVQLRIFLRDQHPDLMEQYLNQRLYRSVPVFVFFDAHMNEIGRFTERPPAIHDFLERKRVELWWQLRAQHRDEWRQATVAEIRSILKR